MSVPRPKPAASLAALEAADRATVSRWEQILGLPWSDIPPLRQLVEMMAVLLLSADTDLPHGDAMRVAAEWLGLEDDDTRTTHSADRYGRTLLNWRRAANGKSFRSSESDAA